MLPKISILIPCYNAERWIAQAIQSSLDQTYLNKEIIVVDDGSSDRSLEIIKSFSDRIHWETQSNQGGNITRNRLLELSTGEWLQYLDADDYLQPNKIAKQAEFLKQHPQADIVYSPSIYEYRDGNHSKLEVLPILEPHDPWILLARWSLPQTNSPLWRKQAIVDVGRWKAEQPCCQEHELYLRLLVAGKQFEYYANAGSVYRQWSETTLCKQNMPETQHQRLAIKDRLEEHLRATDRLTQERLNAINQARFECARMIWLSDRQWAYQIIQQIRHTDKTFVPSGSAAPIVYKFIYRLLGFSIAEHITKFKRNFSLLFSHRLNSPL